MLSSLDFIVKAWKLESIKTLNELPSLCKKCSISSNVGNGATQCIRYVNGVLDGVELLEGFTMDVIWDLLNMIAVV